MDKSVYYLRKFLNKKGFHSNAFIFAEILRSIKKDKTIWRDAELKIADCDRVVHLSIDLHTLRNANNSLHKLNVLIDSLTSFRKALYQEIKCLRKKK